MTSRSKMRGEVPFVTGAGTPSLHASSELPAEFVAPPSNRFIAEQDATSCHHLLHFSKAYAETEVQPNATGNNFFRESMTAVRAARHSYSIPSADETLNVTMPRKALRADLRKPAMAHQSSPGQLARLPASQRGIALQDRLAIRLRNADSLPQL